MAKDQADKGVTQDEFDQKDHEPTPPTEDETSDSALSDGNGADDDHPGAAPTTVPTQTSAAPNEPKGSFFARATRWARTHKKVSIPLAIVLLVGVLAAIPFTRFAIAGLVLKQQFAVQVVDAETKQPVSRATVRLDGVQATTDSKGRATARVAVGKATLEVSKNYYKGSQQTVTVPILKQKDVPQVQLQATGRQVSVKVVNKISKKALANVTIVAADAEAKTDADGTATLVVPAGDDDIEATLTANGFNGGTATVQVLKGEADNTFTLTPSGKVYFLSNQSGKLDVVKTNLDGTDRRVVLAGTGSEDRPNTSLLASRDWRYLALHTRRDSEKAKLYLIDTQNDRLSVMDEGDASFYLKGWSGHNFVYTVDRSNVDYNAAKRQALKAFNADTQKLTTIDENGADTGNSYESFVGTFILDNQIVWVKDWYNNGTDNKPTLTVANADGRNKKVVKTYDAFINSRRVSLDARQYGPQEIYLMYSWYDGSNTMYRFDEYENGQVKALPSYTRDRFYDSPYITYLISPDGDRSFWSEQRDGVQTFFIGNKQGDDGDKIAALPEHNAYGWYTDDYVLIAKDGSQLFIAPRGTIAGEADLTKVTDYYRPDRSYAGYGYGYGGL